MISRWPRPLFYLVILVALVADQLTKAWATASLQPLYSITLIPGLFNLTYTRNRGIAFGMFAGDGLVIGLFMIALALTALYYTRGLNWSRLEPNIVGGFLCGGALGNLLDRARFGSVVDFLDVHLGVYRWPVFNVADSLICIAVGWIVLRQIRGKS
jgi:signal peptidase II